MKNKFIKLFNILIVLLLYTCIQCTDEDALSYISNITDINPSQRKLLPAFSNFGNAPVNQIRATSNSIFNPYINTQPSHIEINNNKQLSSFGYFSKFLSSKNSNYFKGNTRKKVNEIPFTLLHSLRLILANKIIRYNPILYPFQIEFQNISSCFCDLNLDEIENQSSIDFKIKEHFEDDNNYDIKNQENINSSNLYTSYISLLPPNCQWNNNTFNSTYEDFDNLASNNNSYFDSSNNNSKIQYTNLLGIEMNDNFMNDSLKVLESDLNNINKTNNIENITDINNDIVIPKNKTNDDLYLNTNNDSLDKSKEYKFHSKVLIESPDHFVQCIYRIPLDLTPLSKNYKYNNNMVLNDSLANINTSLVENDNDKSNFLSSSWLNYLSPESPKWLEYDFTSDKNIEVFTDDNKYNKFTIEGYWDLIRSIPLQVLLSLNTSDPLTYIMCTNTSETLHNFLIDNNNNNNTNSNENNNTNDNNNNGDNNNTNDNINNTNDNINNINDNINNTNDNINNTNENNDNGDNNNTNDNINNTNENNDNGDNNNTNDNINNTNDNINNTNDNINNTNDNINNTNENNDNGDNNNTNDNINNTNENNDNGDNNNNQDFLNNPNIFSLMSIVPYNESYCSRPTGAQLKMFGFCPSITSSKYDEELQSCIKITYADATSVCPQNYHHSRLWGSRNGGGGCHVKQRVDIPATKTCDFPYTYNEAKEICELKKYYPGFPGCSNGSTYYNITTCIVAYQILKEYECPDDYEALDDSDFNQEDNPSGYNKRMETLQESRENYLRTYANRSYSYNLSPMTRIIDINEQGIQSRYPSLKLNNSKTHITCKKRIIEACEYDHLGIPYCKNNIFKIKYDYVFSYMFEDRPIPQCIFDDIVKVEYKCPKESIPYEIYIANGNNPPIVFTKELGNPYDTCIITEFIPIQPKCITSDQIPYILIRPQLSPFEKTGIHIVTNEDIENLNPDELQEVYDIIDNSLFDENIDNNLINNLDKDENSKNITVANNNNNPDLNNFTGNITEDHIFNKNCTKNNTMNKNKENDINLFNISSNIKEPINQINNTQFLYIIQQNTSSNKNYIDNNTINITKENYKNPFNISNIKEPINQINNTQFLNIIQQNINSNQNYTSINLNNNKYIRISKDDIFHSNIESSVNISDNYTNSSILKSDNETFPRNSSLSNIKSECNQSNILISKLPMEINKNSTTLISNINETNHENQSKVLSNTSMLFDQELSPSYLFKLLNNIQNGNNFSNVQIEEKPRIHLSDAILGNTDYIIQIYCSEIITAKPYLSCPQNSNLIKSNLCRLHGYTDYILQCPDGYVLDEEALILMPVEYYRKAPPRCVSKQLVYTQYYCPPMFPDQIDRPFILNKTNYTNDISKNVDNYQINNISYILQDFENQYNINQFINKYNNNPDYNLSNITYINLVSKSENINQTFNNINNNQISENSLLKNNTENIIGRTIIPSYSQKICHEVDIIEPIWKMPNLLILLLKNIKNFEDQLNNKEI
ncbi:hypothetical protein ACR3K2_25020 [Cryptosporidium serpentis]